MPRRSPTGELHSGQYIQIGLESRGQKQLSKTDSLPEVVRVQFIRDAMTVTCSSNVQLRSILGRVIGPCCTLVFTVGFYCGKGKPSSVFPFPIKYMSELNIVSRKIVRFGTKSAQCTVSSAVRDASPSCFTKQVRGPTGYLDCARCIQRGLYCDKPAAFP